jgi:hypothetical protein
MNPHIFKLNLSPCYLVCHLYYININKDFEDAVEKDNGKWLATLSVRLCYLSGHQETCLTTPWNCKNNTDRIFLTNRVAVVVDGALLGRVLDTKKPSQLCCC